MHYSNYLVAVLPSLLPVSSSPIDFKNGAMAKRADQTAYLIQEARIADPYGPGTKDQYVRIVVKGTKPGDAPVTCRGYTSGVGGTVPVESKIPCQDPAVEVTWSQASTDPADGVDVTVQLTGQEPAQDLATWRSIDLPNSPGWSATENNIDGSEKKFVDWNFSGGEGLLVQGDVRKERTLSDAVSKSKSSLGTFYTGLRTRAAPPALKIPVVKGTNAQEWVKTF